MDFQTVTLFFALLATVAELAIVALLLLRIGSRFSPTLARAWGAVGRDVGPQALLLAAAVALTCTLGSLYLSEVEHLPPCRLCWVQRFFMYPLVVIAVAAHLTRSRVLRIVTAVVAAIGSCVSIWHLLIERYPSLESSTSCDPTNPCSIVWVKRFGYLTIPAMALSGFWLIVSLATLPSGHPTADAPEEAL